MGIVVPRILKCDRWRLLRLLSVVEEGLVVIVRTRGWKRIRSWMKEDDVLLHQDLQFACWILDRSRWLGDGCWSRDGSR